MLRISIYIIIVIFSLILREYLSPLSFLLVLISSIGLISKRTLNQISINIICLIIFTYYLVTHGRVITPEIGINFLLNVTLLKFMECRKFRDEVMCIFGTMLLISAGSLFDKTLIYLLFFTISFIILVQSFFKLNGLTLFALKYTSPYLKLSFLTLILFFIFPRIPNPIPFTLSAKEEGEIGYSSEINISSVGKLVENGATAFWAKLNKVKGREDLYWRGNTVSLTDGWNWTPGPVDQGMLEVIETPLGESQEYRPLIKTPYYFVFDEPSILISGSKSYMSDHTNSFSSSYMPSSGRYFTVSIPKPLVVNLELYGETNLDNKTRTWIRDYFKEPSIDGIISMYRELITKGDFTYSWSPGVIRSFAEFLNKKVGFCTHYASSLALILREKGHPTRLISGFQGGRYNPYGEFYEITQNDAHAWVEVYDGSKWQRIDPTSFIAPERIIMDYQEVISNDFTVPLNSIQNNSSFFNAIKFLVGKWDFEFYQLMDRWDTHVQVGFFSQLKLTRIRLLIICLACLFIISFFLLNKRHQLGPRQRLWIDFLKVLSARGYIFKGSYKELAEDIKESEWDKKDDGLKILNFFIDTFYGGIDQSKEIKKHLKKLNR